MSTRELKEISMPADRGCRQRGTKVRMKRCDVPGKQKKKLQSYCYLCQQDSDIDIEPYRLAKVPSNPIDPYTQ